jgi:hypothetical protein
MPICKIPGGSLQQQKPKEFPLQIMPGTVSFFSTVAHHSVSAASAAFRCEGAERTSATYRSFTSIGELQPSCALSFLYLLFSSALSLSRETISLYLFLHMMIFQYILNLSIH